MLKEKVFFFLFSFFSVDCFGEIDFSNYRMEPANILRKFLHALENETLELKTINDSSNPLYIPYLETQRKIIVKLPDERGGTHFHVNFIYFQALPEDGCVSTTYSMCEVNNYISQMKLFLRFPVEITFTTETITFTIGKGVSGLAYLYQLILNIDLIETIGKILGTGEDQKICLSHREDIRLTKKSGMITPYNSPRDNTENDLD